MSTVVIGAGLAGLFAAHDLAEAGEDVMVLEATRYIGGRTRTDRQALQYGEVADLGASFLDIGQDLLLEFCLKHNITVRPQIRMFPRGPRERYSGASILLGNMVIGEDRVENETRAALAHEVQAALDASPPTEAETLQAWSRRVRLTQEAQHAYLMQGAFNPQTRPELVSSWHVHPGDIGRLCWVLADGTDTIAQTIGRGLDIRYEQPVRLVSRSGKRYGLHTDQETFTADNVIVTSSVQATRRIGFDPVLPDWKLQALLGTPMSQGGKVVAQYGDGQRIADSAAPSVMTDGPVSMFWLKQGAQDTVVVLGTMTDMGDGMLVDHGAALDALDRRVEAMCGLRPKRIAGTVQNWTTEEFIGGVVNLGTGGLARRAALGAPVGRIHFAGEATGEWASAMEGAARSGRRVASEILQKARARQPVATGA